MAGLHGPILLSPGHPAALHEVCRALAGLDSAGSMRGDPSASFLSSLPSLQSAALLSNDIRFAKWVSDPFTVVHVIIQPIVGPAECFVPLH